MVQGKEKGAGMPAAKGTWEHLSGLVGPIMPWRLHFQLPKIHLMQTPSAEPALSGCKKPQQPGEPSGV